MTLGLMAKTKKISQVQEHRHSGGSDRYSVLGEPESRLPTNEEKLASRREEKRNLVEQQYLIDVTASVPVAVPLLTHPDLLRYLGCLWVFLILLTQGLASKLKESVTEPQLSQFWKFQRAVASDEEETHQHATGIFSLASPA